MKVSRIMFKKSEYSTSPNDLDQIPPDHKSARILCMYFRELGFRIHAFIRHEGEAYRQYGSSESGDLTRHE